MTVAAYAGVAAIALCAAGFSVAMWAGYHRAEHRTWVVLRRVATVLMVPAVAAIALVLITHRR